MGNYDLPHNQQDRMTSNQNGRPVVVASSDAIFALKAAAHPGMAGAILQARTADTELPNEMIAQANLLVVEVDPKCDASLRRLAQLRVKFPDLPVIAALRNTDVALARTLIRQGVADIAELPFRPGELAAQILDLLSRQAESSTTLHQATVTTVLHSSGGGGATSVLTHLARALAEPDCGGGSVCLVDLDLQGGAAATYLGVNPSVTIADLLEAGERLDEELIRKAQTPTLNGFQLVAAPQAITPLDEVDIDQLLAILRLLRASHDHVLIDMPSAWTDWTLSVILAANRVLLLTDTSISSLRQAKRRLQLLQSLELPPERLEIVINRAERRLFRTIGAQEVGEALSCKVIASLGSEGSALRDAQDQGALIYHTQSRSKFGSDIRALALQISTFSKGH